MCLSYFERLFLKRRWGSKSFKPKSKASHPRSAPCEALARVRLSTALHVEHSHSRHAGANSSQVRAGLLSLGAADILDWILSDDGAVLCTVGCLAASWSLLAMCQ